MDRTNSRLRIFLAVVSGVKTNIPFDGQGYNAQKLKLLDKIHTGLVVLSPGPVKAEHFIKETVWRQ